jgi:hypothetical protein
MSKFGRLSHFLDFKKRKEIVAFLSNCKNEGENPIFKVYKASNNESDSSFSLKNLDNVGDFFVKMFRAPSKFTAAALDLVCNESILSNLTMVRKGRLVLLLDFQNKWDPNGEEDNFEYRIHMDADLTTLNIHLAKVDDDDIDFPLTVLREEADLFIYYIKGT